MEPAVEVSETAVDLADAWVAVALEMADAVLAATETVVA
jgi:hypothetical protein